MYYKRVAHSVYYLYIFLRCKLTNLIVSSTNVEWCIAVTVPGIDVCTIIQQLIQHNGTTKLTSLKKYKYNIHCMSNIEYRGL